MDGYIPISSDILEEDTDLEFDLYLRSHVSRELKYILFCRVNEKFSRQKKEDILSKNRELFISTNDVDKYIRYQEKSIKSIIADKERSLTEKSNVVYNIAKTIIGDLMNNPESGSNIERVTNWTENTIEHIFNDENTFFSLFEVTSHNYHTYTHSINTSVLGLLFGKHLSLGPYDLNCLGMGMLLHDVGKSKIPPEIINKPEKFTNEDLEIVKKHPEIGLELLKDNINIEDGSLKIVIQHHENDNGTGYPHGIGGSDIHLLGKISRIIDVYDAINSERDYAIAKRPFAALTEMNEKMRKSFDEELFKKFILFLGPSDQRNEKRRKLWQQSTLNY